MLDPAWEQHEVGLEDIILGYMGSERDAASERRLAPVEVAP